MLGLNLFCALSVLLEMVPISSSTHMHFFAQVLNNHGLLNVSRDVLKSFDFFLQGATAIILSLFFLPRARFLPSFFIRTQHAFVRYVLCGIVVEVCTLLFFLLFEKAGTDWWPLWLGFVCTSCALLGERFAGVPQKSASWNFGNSIALGCAQGLAFTRHFSLWRHFWRCPLVRFFA